MDEDTYMVTQVERVHRRVSGDAPSFRAACPSDRRIANGHLAF